MRRTLLLILVLLKGIEGSCQPQFQPVIPTPQPATMPTYGNFNTPAPYNGQVHMGATADDIMRQANRSNPYYGYSNDPQSNQRANEAWIKAQMANDPAYNPQLRNPVRYKAPVSQQQELYNLLKDDFAQDAQRTATNGNQEENYTSPEFATKAKPYTDALKALQDMLNGKRKLSVAEAHYIMENAYGEAYLSQKEFDGIIKQSADFIKEWMKANNLSLHDNAAIHYAIQKFMSERLTIIVSKQNGDQGKELQTITHDPIFYDYNDYTGDKDFRDFFLTKCLATGMGQCNSMPAVYLCLAEALGAKAYLARAPQHALLKYPDDKGKLRNYEATSNWDITDQWYLDNMFISRKAQQNGIYLQPMDKKQIVADCILQLSWGYHHKFGSADGKFEMDCINTAKRYFPKNNDIDVYFSYSNLYGYQLGQIMRAQHINRLSDIPKSTAAEKAYEKWKANEDIIESLGYEDNPPGLYEEMMKYHEFRGKVQAGYGITGKQKHSLFTTVN